MRLLAVLVALMLGCKSREAPAPTPATSTTPTVSVPVNDAEQIKAFAETFATEAMPCDTGLVAKRIDAQGLAAAVAPAKLEDPSTAGARVLCAWLQGVDSYKLVAVREIDGRMRPVMRRLAANPKTKVMMVSYDTLELVRRVQGSEVQIADAFSYRQGKRLSQLVLPNEGTTADVLKHLRAGQPAEAVKVVDAAAPDVRKTRDVQLLRVTAAAAISPDDYAKALDEIAALFPDDPAIALTMLDGALARKDVALATHWIDVLKQAIGSDAYLLTLRAIAQLDGDRKSALADAQAAIVAEPTLTRAQEVKLDILIAQKSWKEALAQMTELETKHGMRFDEAKLRSEPKLKGLVASPAFKTWLAAR